MRREKFDGDNSAVTLWDWSAGAFKRDRKEETVLTDEQYFETQAVPGPNYTQAQWPVARSEMNKLRVAELSFELTKPDKANLV